MKILNLIAAIFLVGFTAFGQDIHADIAEGNPVDSTIATYRFCLIIPVRADNYVMLQCKDKDGQMIYMRIREDIFHGKITINILPDENLGPIMEEEVFNWHILPEVSPDSGTIEYEKL